MTASTRAQVLEQIADVIYQAEGQGLNGLTAAERAYPGLPKSVIGEALWLAEERRADEWWQGVERTIDGEIIKAALLKGGVV